VSLRVRLSCVCATLVSTTKVMRCIQCSLVAVVIVSRVPSRSTVDSVLLVCDCVCVRVCMCACVLLCVIFSCEQNISKVMKKFCSNFLEGWGMVVGPCD